MWVLSKIRLLFFIIVGKKINVMELSSRLSVDLISESIFRSKGGALSKTEDNLFKQIGDMVKLKKNHFKYIT